MTAADDPRSGPARATILLVEDNRLVRDTLIATLGSLGYRVLAAVCGEEARTILEGTEPIDLLFTDFTLPQGPNGASIAAFARERRPSIQVLFTSGFPAESLREPGGLSPSDEFLMKPYDLSELGATLARMLRV